MKKHNWPGVKPINNDASLIWKSWVRIRQGFFAGLQCCNHRYRIAVSPKFRHLGNCDYLLFSRCSIRTTAITSSASDSCCCACTATPTRTRWCSGRSRCASCQGSRSTASGSRESPALPSGSRKSRPRLPTNSSCNRWTPPPSPVADLETATLSRSRSWRTF